MKCVCACAAQALAAAFAEQELSLYQRIRPEEFVEKVVHPGSTDAPNVKCRHLVAMIGWANQIGYWLAVSVCVTQDLRKRVKLLTRFIELAAACQQYGCYNTVFAIVTGLSNSLITRLKKTWAVRVAARRRPATPEHTGNTKLTHLCVLRWW